jgi:sRNA-binding regulator protein Hfq
MDKRHYSPLPMGLSPVLVPRFCHLASLPLACRRAALALASLVLLTGMGLVATTARGWADTLMLRDGVTIAGQKVSGASLQGDVVGIDDQYVILRNSQGQAQRVPKAQIDTIRFGSRIDPLASPTNSGWTPPISHESPSILSPTDTTTEPDNSFALWRFPDNNGKFNKDIFGVLATFKGESTGNLYAGLYNFDDKGTFWVRLPKQNAPKASQMRFTLYGKHYPQQRLEPFTVKAQFFNSGGTRIGESAQVRF